jgi:hypothetical protein
MASDRPTVVVEGTLRSRTDLTGRGTVTFLLDDLTRASFGLERTRSATVLRLSSRTGIRIEKDTLLRFGGALEQELEDGSLAGEVEVSLTLPDGLRASVETKLAPGDVSVGARISVRL